MKRLLLAIAILVVSTSWASGQAIYTSNGTGGGNWTTAATWTHTGTPCNGTTSFPVSNGDPANTVGTTCGDVAIIQSGDTVACSVAHCTVGNSPVALVLSAVAAGTGVYTGTITGGGSNAYAGYYFAITGFGTAANNGNFICTASTITTLTLTNASSATETHAGAAIVNAVTGLGSGGLTINSGEMFIFSGPIQMTTGVYTVGSGSGGATIQYDSSYSSAPTTVNYNTSCTARDCSASAFTWLVRGTSGSHAVIDGDSFDSPYNNAAACTAINTCLAGAFNYNGGSVYSTANQGQGTISYLDIKNVAGTSAASHGFVAWVTTVKSGSNSAWDHITVTNSGTMSINEAASSTVGWTVNGLAVTKSRYTQAIAGGQAAPVAQGCFAANELGTTSGTFSISNAYMDCVVNQVATSGAFGVFTWRNVAMYLAPGYGPTPGEYVGIMNGGGVSSTDLFDEYMVYASSSWTGVSNTNSRPNQPIAAMVNSVLWSPKATVSGTHIATFTGGYPNAAATSFTNAKILNNSWGATGSILASPGTDTVTSVGIAGSSLIQNLTTLFSGNIILPDQFGWSSMGEPFVRFTAPFSTHTMSVTAINNVSYSEVQGGLASTADWQTNGASGWEGAATQASVVVTDNSNVHWNFQGKTPTEVCDSASANFLSPNQPILLLTNNACASTGAVGPCICNNGGANDPKNWVATGPQNDVIMTHTPVMVNYWYSIPTFDSYYLIPSGLLGGTVGQSAHTYWVGQGATAWAGSTSYATGALVYDTSGAWNGIETYWRCVNTTNCNSGSTSPNITRPSIGSDPGNLFSDYNAYWQPAWFQAWLFPQIFSGATFAEGAVPQMYDINSNPESMHAIGLLNQWLHQGMRTMEPNLWGGCLNGAECGNSYTAIQHIPPPVLSN